MQDWTPYLHELLGDDSHGHEQAKEVLTLSRVLLDDRLQVRDRVRLLDSVTGLDSARQIFLLPWLLDLLPDPSHQVRGRLLALLDELLGNTQTPLVYQLGKLLDAAKEPEKILREILDRLSEMLRQEAGVELEAPFSALLFLRTPAFGLTMLLALARWAQEQPRSAILKDEMQSFFDDDEQAPLRELLQGWLRKGPLFLRYLIVRWLGRSSVDLDSSADTARLLYTRYRIDPDPLVAGSAMEAFVRRVEPEAVTAAVRRIAREYATFRDRSLRFGTGLPAEGVRTLSLSLLRALGYLAVEHYPKEEALEALRRILTTWPYKHLDLGGSKRRDEEKRSIFRAALLLRGATLRFPVKPRREKEDLFGLPGFASRIRLEDPRGVLKKKSWPKSVWAAAVPGNDAPDPLEWTFEVLENPQGKAFQGAFDFTSMASPALSRFLSVKRRPYEFSVELRRQLEREIDQRGWWMLEACDVVARVVVAGLEQGDRLEADPLHFFFGYLSDLAIAAAIVRSGEVESLHHRLKSRTRSIFLNRFARQEVFAFLFPEKRANPLEAQLLIELAQAVLRSLPEAPANQWISRNYHVLRGITLEKDWHVRLRGIATVALFFHGAKLAQSRPIERELFHLPGREVFLHCSQALAFVSDEDLDTLRREELQRMDPLQLAADPGRLKRQNQVVLLWAEIFARTLERDEADTTEAKSAAAVCLTALSERMRLDTATRLRLLYAFGLGPAELSGSARRLLDHLLRTSSSAELQLYLHLQSGRQKHPSAELWHRVLSILTQETKDGVLEGTRLLDIHGIADSLARRRVILRALSAQLKSNRDFFAEYRRLREEELPLATPRIVPAGGDVLPVGAAGEPRDVVLSELRTLPHRDAETDKRLAEIGGDILPSFIYHPQARSPLSCLAQVTTVPANWVDFHALPFSPRVKRRILEQRLTEASPLWVLGRVEAEEEGGEIRVDLGVEWRGVVPRRPVLSAQEPLQADDPVIVELRREAKRQRRLTDLKLRPWWGSQDVRKVDLRGEHGALNRLETLYQSKEDFKLRASVERLIPQDSGKVLCLLKAGFRWYRDGNIQRPAVSVEPEEAPQEGEEILVDRPFSLRFEDVEVTEKVESVELRVVRRRRAHEGWVVAGTLRSERLANGRRRWWGRVGEDLELPIDRRGLTGDLKKLFDLDEADEEDPRLVRLATERTLLQVVDQGRRFSIRDAPPCWRGFDVLLAVQAQGTLWATFLQRIGQRMLFELGSLRDEVPAETSIGLPALGALASLDEGELFDQEGTPAAPGLRPGMRLLLQVTHGQLSATGGLLASPGEEAGPWDAPFLQCVEEPDESALRFREEYSRDTTVRVRLGGSGHDPELLDIVSGFPAPAVAVDPKAPVHGIAGSEVDVTVTSDWQPEAESYSLTVSRIQERKLHMDHRALDREVLHYMQLDSGVSLRGRKYFHGEGQQLVCFAGGLRVFLDPQMHYLVPELLQARDLNAAALEAVRLTRVERPYYKRIPPSQGRPEVPFIKEYESVHGLVIGTPDPSSGSTQVSILWQAGHPDPDSQHHRPKISGRWAFDSPLPLFNGDVLRAELKGDEAELTRIQRRLTGTVLHRAIPCVRWAEMLPPSRRRGVHGTLLRRPEKQGESWLFAFAPAHLVEVFPDQLLSAKVLEDAWSLDRIRFDVDWSTKQGASRVHLKARDHRPGPLREAIGEKWNLEVRRHNKKTRTFSCVLQGPGAVAQLGELPLELAFDELPPHQKPRDLVRRFNEKPNQKIPVTCTLSAYRLEVRQEIDEGDPQPRLAYEFEIRPRLDTYVAQQKKPKEKPQKPLLSEALKATGRVDTTGRVIQVGDALGVLLNHFRHNGPIPLPITEVTWILHSGMAVEPPWSGKLTIFLNDQGEAVASLRRRTPMTLEDWLKKSGILETGRVVSRQRLLYFKELGEEERKLCNLSEEDGPEEGEDPLVLFESGPGAAFTVPVRRLLFMGAPFDPQTLGVGDAVLSFRVLELSTAGAEEEDDDEKELVLDILKIELDVARHVENFAEKQHGIHFGHVELVDGKAILTELRGADAKGRAYSRKRMVRWSLRLEDPSTEELSWLKELGEDDFVYLKLVRADRETGELIFRLATPEEVLEEKNLIFVQGQGIVPYGDHSLQLAVKPVGKLGKEELAIPDTLFSLRRWRLQTSKRVHEGIFPAKVHRKDVRRGRVQVKLSLIHNPVRRFDYLIKGRSDWQAIVKWANPEELEAEVGEGINVEIPRRVVDGLDDLWLQPGDVLFLKSHAEKFQLELLDRIHSHVSYLDLDTRPTVLTQLWGSHKTRQKQFAKKEGHLNCNLIGLPQLKGLCKVSKESVNADHPLAQAAQGLSRGFVRLEEGTGRNAFVGRLSRNEAGVFEICNNAGEEKKLRPENVTFYEGDAGEKEAWTQQLRWRNGLLAEESEDVKSSDVIAHLLGGPWASLTELARRPFPVDHLVEQFPLPESKDALLESRSFVVARADLERLILEVAPGRYAELPTSLIEPLQDDPLQPGLSLFWGHLYRGDVIRLEQLAKRGPAEELLPRFRVLSLQPGEGRHLEGPLVTVLRRLDDGRVVVGPEESPIPVPGSWAAVLRDPAAGEGVVTSCRVRVHQDRAVRHDTLPEAGDSVIVFRPTQEEDVCALGYEDFAIVWDESQPDPLCLHEDAARKKWSPLLFAQSGDRMWATVEDVDPGGRRLLLSRRIQLARTEPYHGKVTRACVVAMADGGDLLVDLLGVPSVLPLEELCLGAGRDLDMSPWIGSLGREIEVTSLGKDSSLSALRVYRPPAKGDFESQVECVLPSGLLARAKGSLIFVEKRELAWCELADLRPFFPAGESLRLVRRKEIFSHVQTYDVRSEVNELIRSGGPAYVALQALDESGRRAIVRGRSGILMELRLDPKSEIGDRFCTFVEHVDSDSRSLVLSLEEASSQVWDLPTIRRRFAVDQLTPRVIEASLASLRGGLREQGYTALEEWAQSQTRLEPVPRNLRLVLEAIAEVLEPEAVGSIPESSEGDPRCEFHSVWQELQRVLCRKVSPEEIDGRTRFALGYWLLQTGHPDAARRQLDLAISAPEARNHFDTHLARARAHYLAGDRDEATTMLRRLGEQLWGSALRTLGVPLFGPSPAGAVGSDTAGDWETALDQGALKAISDLSDLLDRRIDEIGSARSWGRRIWLEIARGGKRRRLDRLVQDFFEAMEDQESLESAAKPRLFLLAAYLSFARGEVLRAWSYLDSVEALSWDVPELETAYFWRRWLKGDGRPEPDPQSLLGAMLAVLRQSRWRPECDAELFDKLWEQFRKSPHQWLLTSPRCRALPRPPRDEPSLVRWVEENRAQAALRYFLDSMEETPEPSSEEL